RWALSAGKKQPRRDRGERVTIECPSDATRRMNISAPFVLRPIATTLLTLAIALLGAIGSCFLPVSALPATDFPTIQVTTAFPGASPDVVETSITAPLEHHFGEISGLKAMSSTSAYGTSQIALQFALSRNIDAA